MPAIFEPAFSSWLMPVRAQYLGTSLVCSTWPRRAALVGNMAARTAILFTEYIHKKTKLQVTLDDMEMF